MYIKIVYTLNDGKQVKRAYYGVNQDIYNMLLDLDKSDYRTARLYDAFSVNTKPKLNIQRMT